MERKKMTAEDTKRVIDEMEAEKGEVFAAVVCAADTMVALSHKLCGIAGFDVDHPTTVLAGQYIQSTMMKLCNATGVDITEMQPYLLKLNGFDRNEEAA